MKISNEGINLIKSDFQIGGIDGEDFAVVGFEAEASVRIHVENQPGFLDAAFAAVAVFVRAVVVYDDGAATPEELVHLSPGIYPRRDAEGLELPEGSFQRGDEGLKQLFAVGYFVCNCL